ncbi:MAG: ATPase [Spirochaetae bacterium HGW-Spirochaetae-8]|nr:MAG: ATPase [Spirochaetae bacterium HGW-Spirochaetae-8]
MIASMKKVSVIVLAYDKKRSLHSLRKAGLLHIIDVPVRSDKAEVLQKDLELLEKAESRIRDAVAAIASNKKESQSVSQSSTHAVVAEDFADVHAQVAYLMEEERDLNERKQKYTILRDQLESWGDFNPEDLRFLKENGVELTFHRIGRKELDKIAQKIDFISLGRKAKSQVVALVNSKVPEGSIAERLDIPSIPLSQLKTSIATDTRRLAAIEQELNAVSNYLPLYATEIAKLKQLMHFENIASTMGADDTVAWLTGFIPNEKTAAFKALASKEKWGYLIEDPAEDDQVPTLIKNPRWIATIKPIFDIMGTVPGYHEYDISMWFLMFFSLFFAMIIGDAAYGMIFLILGIAVHLRLKKATNAVILIYVLSIATIVWGSLTGTWFGSKAILEAVPFLQFLVIPQISNYPELFGLSATSAQNAVMQFCFIVGTLQLSLACVMNILRKIPKKNLSALADVGWFIMIDSLYFLVLMLVINADIPISGVALMIGIGFLLVVMFAAQGPGISFLKGLVGGIAGLFTTFLNSISAFSNIISYIRLFAVGMASLAIAQSFNTMASGLLHGWAIPAGILVLIIGHGLNLIMGLLSVVVHGVRLNLLEFSGQLGMEWTGVVYDPFRETVEESQTL